MKKLIWIALFLPLIIKAQEKGIEFEKGLTWEQIKAKAKSENKYIFVDCFATWCGPCKAMDNLVYPTDTIGGFANAHFISVKVQMDTSKNDNESIRAGYATAHMLQSDYKVFAFPTFLFFSPEGKAVGKSIGAKNVKKFRDVLEQALKPEFQYYTLLQKFQSGQLPLDQLPDLAKSANDFNEKDMSLVIARQYMVQFLDKLSEAEFCKQPNVQFLATYQKMLNSHDRLFDLCYHKPGLVDTAMKYSKFSKGIVDNVINMEEVKPVLDAAIAKGGDADWKKIATNITKKYGKVYSERITTNAKPGFYKIKKDWKNYCKYLVEKVEKAGFQDMPANMWGAYVINNYAWDIFLHSENKGELEKALSWTNRSITMMPLNLRSGCIDTRACILYKTGRVQQAIDTEESAIKMEKDQAIQQHKTANVKRYSDNIEKMKKGAFIGNDQQ